MIFFRIFFLEIFKFCEILKFIYLLDYSEFHGVPIGRQCACSRRWVCPLPCLRSASSSTLSAPFGNASWWAHWKSIIKISEGETKTVKNDRIITHNKFTVWSLCTCLPPLCISWRMRPCRIKSFSPMRSSLLKSKSYNRWKWTKAFIQHTVLSLLTVGEFFIYFLHYL